MKTNIKIWKRIALVAGWFSFVVCIILIVNYIQLKRIDVVENKVINTLVEKLNETPEDQQLRDEIRTIDLLSRKAYFTSQWQVRTGGYLLLLGVALFTIAMQIVKAHEKLNPNITENDGAIFTQKTTKKYVSIGGGAIVITALVFSFLTHNELSTAFATANLPDTLTTNISENSNLQNLETQIPDSANLLTDTAANGNVELLSEYPTYQEIIKNHSTFRGYGGNGISYHKNIPTNWNGASGANIAWKTPIPIHSYNSPIIWDDKIFLSGADATKREVYCFDRITGKLLWTAPVNNIIGSPAVSPKVTEDTGYAASTLATDGRRVYAIFANGDIIALDMNGERVWAKNLGVTGNHYGHSSSLMLLQNVLIVQYDTKTNPKLMGLSTTTGNVLWTTPREVKISWASPVVAYTGAQTEIFLAAEPYVASYNPFTGKENWRIKSIFGEVGPSVAYADSIVYAVNEYANLYAIKIGATPEIIWENPDYLSDVPSPVVTNGLLFLATSYGAVVCYDAKTGEQKWLQEFENGFYSSPMVAEGKVFVMDMSGNMHIFKASATYSEISNSPLGESSMTTPAFTDGHIYIRGEKYLYCIGK